MADQLNTTAPSGRVGFINFDLVGAALLHTRLEKSCRWVLVALCSYANLTQHRAWPSVASLARRAGCSERTAQSRLRQLERAGYIAAVRDGQHSTIAYQIAADKLLREPSGSASAAPPFAPAKTAPRGAETAAAGVQPLHPKKEGEEKIENRKEGSARAAATAWADSAAQPVGPTFPVLASEGFPAGVPCPAPVAVVAVAAAPAVVPVAITAAAPSPAAPTPAPNPALAREQAVAAPALPSRTLERLNAQRAGNGKGALTPRDLVQLATEATQAGLTPLDAAQWVLAKPQRNFFKAAFYAPPAVVAAPAPVVQRCPAPTATPIATPAAPGAEAQAGQDYGVQQRRADIERLLASLSSSGKPSPGSANGHTAQTAPPARDTRWATRAIELLATGQPVSHYRLKIACEVLGLDLRALLQQQRAAAGTAS